MFKQYTEELILTLVRLRETLNALGLSTGISDFENLSVWRTEAMSSAFLKIFV